MASLSYMQSASFQVFKNPNIIGHMNYILISTEIFNKQKSVFTDRVKMRVFNVSLANFVTVMDKWCKSDMHLLCMYLAFSSHIELGLTSVLWAFLSLKNKETQSVKGHVSLFEFVLSTSGQNKD